MTSSQLENIPSCSSLQPHCHWGWDTARARMGAWL